MHKDKHARSILKAITYRIVSIVLDTTIAYLVTQSASKTFILVVISNTASIVLYFIHERAWNKVIWGKRLMCDCATKTM